MPCKKGLALLTVLSKCSLFLLIFEELLLGIRAVWINVILRHAKISYSFKDFFGLAQSFCISQIIIIIMSCRLHGYPWPSLAIPPYRSSPLAGLQGYILYPHIAAVCKFELVVLLLLGHMWGSIGVHHLWARPCFSSSVLHVWFV